MKAITFARYGTADALELQEVERPAPGPNEVLIGVRAVGLNDWDWQILQGIPFSNRVSFGLLRPHRNILGSDVAGVVEDIGGNVTLFRPGDQVFGDLSGRWGGFAEYVCAKEATLLRKPAEMTFEEAAALPQAGALAVQGLVDQGRIREGQKVLINGAGGGVGTFALQIAKTYQAEVTGVDSEGKLDMLRSLGFDHVIDYVQEDFTQSERRHDLILDVKTNRSLSAYLRVLEPGGAYVTVGGSTGRILQTVVLAPFTSLVRGKRARLVLLKPNKGLTLLTGLFEAGKLRPVVDGHYTLAETPEAMRHFAQGRHRGKIVITVQE